eukprot:11190944-Lingulodinium_polyedra.AAC.1
MIGNVPWHLSVAHVASQAIAGHLAVLVMGSPALVASTITVDARHWLDTHRTSEHARGQMLHM